MIIVIINKSNWNIDLVEVKSLSDVDSSVYDIFTAETIDRETSMMVYNEFCGTEREEEVSKWLGWSE